MVELLIVHEFNAQWHWIQHYYHVLLLQMQQTLLKCMVNTWLIVELHYLLADYHFYHFLLKNIPISPETECEFSMEIFLKCIACTIISTGAFFVQNSLAQDNIWFKKMVCAMYLRWWNVELRRKISRGKKLHITLTHQLNDLVGKYFVMKC